MPDQVNIPDFPLDISTPEKSNTTLANCLRLKGFIETKIISKQLEFLAGDLAVREGLLDEILLLEKCSKALLDLSEIANEFANLEDPEDPLDEIRQMFDDLKTGAVENGSYATINQLWSAFIESGGEEFVLPAGALLLGADEPMPDA